MGDPGVDGRSIRMYLNKVVRQGVDWFYLA
jgi:hypothetical protein